ncbi:MAG: glycosyltransferase family 4 protein [Chloroflexota bacterium]|nr:glycosyltransferase family 4 protein [Chloroflexota bacterium]
MTHILLISRYYPPEKAAAAVCVSETAKCLVKLGYQVTVLTTVPNYPTGVVPTEYRGYLVHEEVLDDVRVVRVWSYISPNEGFVRRILAQLSFGCSAPFLAFKAVGQPDIIIVESPPLFNVIAARMLAGWKRCPLIFWVADLWPESAVQLGILRNRLLIRLSEWLEWSTYQRAHIVWAVTEGIHKTLLRRGIPLEKLLLITNGVDTTRFRPLPQAHARAELGWDERFTLLYAGNHGLVYSMMTLLDVAELLQDDSDIHIILAGEGVKKAELVAEAQRRQLKNVTFLDAVPHEHMPLLWAAADISLIPLRKLSLLEGSLPIKMFEVMACARPFVLGAEGIARNLAEQQANAGMVVEPENAAAFVSAILYLRAHPEEAEAFGRQGREYVKVHFDYERLTRVLDARLQILLGQHEPATDPETPVPTRLSEIDESCEPAPQLALPQAPVLTTDSLKRS